MNYQVDLEAITSTVVRRGELVFAGVATHERNADPGALAAELVARLGQLVERVGTDIGHAIKLGVYWMEGQFASQQEVLDILARSLAGSARPAVTCVPVPAYAGTETLRIDAIVNVEAAPVSSSAAGSAFPAAVRAGRFIAVSAQGAPEAGPDYPRQNELAMEHMDGALSEFGASLDDVVKFNVFYVGQGNADEWAIGAEARARSFPDPGPAATGVPVAHLGDPDCLVIVDALAMLAEDGMRLPRTYSWPEGHWDWPVRMPYKHGGKCQEMVYFGGQVSLTAKADVIDPDDLPRQIATSVDYIRAVLAGFDAQLTDVVQLTAFYSGDETACAEVEALVAAEEGVRPGEVVISAVHLPYLAYEKMVVEIEGVAIVERTSGSDGQTR